MRLTPKGLLIAVAVWIPGVLLATTFPPALLLVPFFSAYPAVLFGCGFLPAVIPSIAAEALLAWWVLGYRAAAQHAGAEAGVAFDFAGVLFGFALFGGVISAAGGAWAAGWEAQRRKEAQPPSQPLVRSTKKTIRLKAISELDTLPFLDPGDAVVVFSEDAALTKSLRDDPAARENICKRLNLREEKGLGIIAFRWVRL